MNRATEDSKNFDIVCMSFGKEQEKGIELVKAGKKDSFIEANAMEIKTEKSKLLENGNLEKENGNIIVNFANYKKIKENNKNRLTKYALEKAEKEGKTTKINKRKNYNNIDREIVN